jgi:hypothetical protein
MNMNAAFKNTRGWHHFSRAKFGFFAALALMLGAITATTLGAYVRTGGTGAKTTFGEIDAFGSVVVNGVHYDETGANIIVDGTPGQSRAALKLGMIAQIDGTIDYALNTGVADVIRVDRVLFGQIEDINPSATEVRILQQRVSLTSGTRVEGALGLNTLIVGDWIAVHGLDDPGRKSVVASLIERLDAPDDGASSIRGTVQNVQRSRLRIGQLNILVANNNAQDGDFVFVKGDYLGGALVASGAIVTQEVETHENVETELQGYVAAYRGVDQFTIAGVIVDASAAKFSGGRASDLRQNARITVEGPVVNGVLMAEEIEFPTTLPPVESIEIEGTITSFSSMADFVIKGRHIDAGDITLTSAKMPKVGWKAHVKGSVATDGIIKAKKAEFARP